MDFDRERVWAEIDLDDLIFTYRQVRKMACGKTLMPVIKSDAYGHGAIPLARAYLEEGVKHFAVATAGEALELREAGVDAPLLVLGPVPTACVKDLAMLDVTLCVSGMETARQYLSVPLDRPLKVHLKVDTGMNRLGFEGVSSLGEIAELASNPAFNISGIFTHFAASGDSDRDDFTVGQYRQFEEILAALATKGIRFADTHCANSDAIVRFPQFKSTLTRPGIVLLGYANPSPNLLPLRPALSLRARISQVRWIEAGQTVSYSCRWTASVRTKIATVSIGYADGLLWSGSMKLDMLVHGMRAPQIGRICMDMCMLDVTHIPGVERGDVATIVGRDGAEQILMDEVARHCDTITYEPFTLLNKRVPRYYLRDKKPVSRMAVTDKII